MTWLALARPLGLVAVLPFVGAGAPLVALAVAFVLASWLVLFGGPPVGATATGELAIGLVLGLATVGPVWSARLAGALGDRAADREHDEDPLERLYAGIGLAVFAICGGPSLLVAALARSRGTTQAATAVTLGAQLGKALLMGLELGAPLLAAGLVAAAARLAIGRLGARSLVLQHRLVSFGAVVVMCLLAMSGQIAAMARMMVR